MKAILLAAGKGTRLGKITRNIPKPMIEIHGRPILDHNIRFLKSYGIRDIFINLHYLPDVITDYFSDGSSSGVSITYSYEKELLGTAGAVRKIADEYWDKPERFVVMYGDNLFEYNLREILDFHESKSCVATIAVYEKKNVSQSGIVSLDAINKITNFIEKPKRGEVVSNLVNTGIYVLESKVLTYIAPNTFLDFGKDVFPEMIQKGENIYGKIVGCHLTAIDNPKLLRKALQVK